MTPSQPSRVLPRTTVPARRPVGPRRVSGPSRPAPVEPPIRRLVDHRLLDRLIRGRTWIVIVAFALIGIVTMQVALLKLNTSIGRSVERATVLAHENALLAAQVSTLQADDLHRAETAAQGMVYAPPGDVRYLTAGNGDAAAAGTMVAPGGGGASTSSGQTSTTTAGPSPSQTAPATSVSQTTGSAPTLTQPVGATPSIVGTQGAGLSPSTGTTPAGGQSSGLVGGAVAGSGG